MATISRTRRVTWKGAKELCVRRARWRASQDSTACTLSYEGPYDLCRTKAPKIGQKVEGFNDDGIVVNGYEIEPADGGRGTLTIYLENPQTGGSESSEFTQIGKSVPELQWQPIQRQIEEHPKCGRNTSGMTENGHIPAGKYEAAPGRWTEQQYRKLFEAGINTYEAYQPVLTLVTYSYARFNFLGANNHKIEQLPAGLPVPVNPSGGVWAWLRGGDQLTRDDGKWRLMQVWTGLFSTSEQDALTNLLYS